MAGRYDFIDEGGPVVRPFLLEYRDENEIEFVQESSLLFKGFFGGRGLYDEVDYEVPDT